MHRYYKHIGDYAKKTGRLNMLQHGAFSMLMDACYDRESFPTEKQAIEWTWASTPEEEQAVRFILSRFFTLQDDGTYVQNRIHEEIESYKINGVVNRLIAISREARKQNRDDLAKEADNLRLTIKNDPLSKTHAAWTSVVDALVNKHDPAPNQKPLNQKPLTDNQIIDGADAPEREQVAKQKRFKKPSVEEVRTYMAEQGNQVHDEADRFFNYHESKGWKVSNSPMKDWKAAAKYWLGNQSRFRRSGNVTPIAKANYGTGIVDL